MNIASVVVKHLFLYTVVCSIYVVVEKEKYDDIKNLDIKKCHLI